MNDFFNKSWVTASKLYNYITGKNEIDPIFRDEENDPGYDERITKPMFSNSISVDTDLSRADEIMKGMQLPGEEPKNQLENIREQDVLPREAGETLKDLNIESSIASDQVSAPNTPSERSAGHSINL